MGKMSEAKQVNSKNKKKLGSDLVVQRSRYHHFEVFFEIYKMGMVSEARTWKYKITKTRIRFGRAEVSIP